MLGLAPLPKEKNQHLLAGGLYAVFPERKLRRRFAFAQQSDAVAQALGELARIEIAHHTGLLRRWVVQPFRHALAGEIDDERCDALVFRNRLPAQLELGSPPLEEK